MSDTENDDAVERWLSAVLAAEPPTADEAFTAAVLERIGREARYRRSLLAIGYVAAGIVGMVSVPEASAALPSLTSATLAATMALSAVCGVVWIGTE